MARRGQKLSSDALRAAGWKSGTAPKNADRGQFD
jgi:hypothetical protein